MVFDEGLQHTTFFDIHYNFDSLSVSPGGLAGSSGRGSFGRLRKRGCDVALDEPARQRGNRYKTDHERDDRTRDQDLPVATPARLLQRGRWQREDLLRFQ